MVWVGRSVALQVSCYKKRKSLLQPRDFLEPAALDGGTVCVLLGLCELVPFWEAMVGVVQSSTPVGALPFRYRAGEAEYSPLA
jgi:hypothetical protein